MAAIHPADFMVESVVKVDKQFLNMSLADEDKLYGSAKDFVAAKIQELDDMCVWYKAYDKWCPREIDLVWEGWDAAFIKSKGDGDWPVATLETTGLGALGLKKRKKLEEFSLSKEADHHEEDDDYMAIFTFRKPHEIKPKEHAVAMMAYQVAACFPNWSKLERAVGPDCCGAFRKHLFHSSVKFVLSIFDEEDFYRISHWNEIRAEYMRFCISQSRKSESFASLGDRKFTYLREADVYEACSQLNAYAHEMVEYYQSDGSLIRYSNGEVEFRIEPAIDHKLSMKCFKESDVSEALKLMQNQRPLKGHLQAQLMLELSRLKCFHVNDTLMLEAFKGLDLAEIYRKCESDDSDTANQCRDFLSHMGDVVLARLMVLSVTKSDELRGAEGSLIKGMQCVFGPFKDEVYEVVKRANHERRKGNKQFTGLAHIWRALSFSRVRDCLPEIVKNHLCPELCLLYEPSSSQIYTFRLYELSRELASNLGHEEVGLEHLVFSILYGSSERKLMEISCEEGKHQLFQRLRESQADSKVKSWRNIEVYTTLFQKRCRFGNVRFFGGEELMKKLHEAELIGRLVLPKFEKLQAMY